MDIKKFGMEELLLAAIKSEVESERTYTKVAERVKNAFLKERLRFLANEEMKHRQFLEFLYRKKIGDGKIVLPEKSRVPLPEIEIGDENDPISLVLESAMKAEKAAEEFYNALSERFEEEDIRKMLKVFANMEYGHYKILESEYENAKVFEEYDTVWPMMHVGP